MELKLDQKDIKPLIDAQIQIAIAKALGEHPEALISACVNQALSTRCNDYDKKTVFQKNVEEMIREVARDTFKAWIEDKKPLIRSAIIARLKSEEASFFDAVAEKLVSGLGSSFYVECKLRIED